MKRITVKSSNVAEVGYEDSTRTLEVEFNDGSIYQYSGVPASVHEGLLDASARGESVGRYFDRYVKKAGFKYSKLR